MACGGLVDDELLCAALRGTVAASVAVHKFNGVLRVYTTATEDLLILSMVDAGRSAHYYIVLYFVDYVVRT